MRARLLAGREKILLTRALSLSAHISFCISGSNVLTFEGGSEGDVGRRTFLMNVSIEWLKLLAQRSDQGGERGRERGTCGEQDSVCGVTAKGRRLQNSALLQFPSCPDGAPLHQTGTCEGLPAFNGEL